MRKAPSFNYGRYAKSTALNNVRRFEAAVREHAFRGTLIGAAGYDREAEAMLNAIDEEYEHAKAALIRNIKLGVR